MRLFESLSSNSIRMGVTAVGRCLSSLYELLYVALQVVAQSTQRYSIIQQ